MDCKTKERSSARPAPSTTRLLLQRPWSQYRRPRSPDLDPPALRAAFEALSSALESLRLAVETYAGPDQALVSALAAVIDLQSDTAGWQDFLDVAKEPAALRNGLIEARARSKVRTELEAETKANR